MFFQKKEPDLKQIKGTLINKGTIEFNGPKDSIERLFDIFNNAKRTFDREDFESLSKSKTLNLFLKRSSSTILIVTGDWRVFQDVLTKNQIEIQKKHKKMIPCTIL